MNRRDALGVLAAAAAQPLMGAPARPTFGVEGDRFVLNGKPWVIRSGEMHYARVPREYWRDRMRKMRAMGLNTLCMYSFWNLHEPRPGEFDFTGNLDIAAFIRTAQEEGLWVIVRPGPYSCAEWEFGGYPSWLFKDPDIKVRTTDPRFLEPAGRYLKRLVKEVVPMQITRGGPVILAQVENEYGSFGKDKEYLNAIRKMLVDGGLEITLYTSDGSLDYMLSGGTLPDLLSVVNFGGDPRGEFSNFARFRKGVPLMCGEYWVGWFDHWGEQHHTGDNKVHLDGLNWMLERNISFNLYMVHGGTSFGPMAGANFDKVYQPDITSYDYDSPIDEAGRPAKKFAAYRAVIEKHLLPGEVLPELPAPLPVIEVPRFELTESAPLLPEMKPVLTVGKPQTFESIGLDYGFVLYETPMEGARQGKLRIDGLHDYAVVMQGARVLGRLDRRLEQDSLEVELRAGEPLRILVENMGRINFGLKLMEDRKGILGAVTLNGEELHGWSMCPYQIGKLRKLAFSRRAEAAPAFWRGTFALAAAADTYIDTQGWGKGYVWVNSHCLGRHWKIGPQQTLYCPKQFLKRGVNEVAVLDLEDGGARTLAGVKDPVWANA